MAQSVSAGPLLVIGALVGGQSGTQPREYSDEIGPSLFWGGVGFPATGAIASKDKKGTGTIPALSGAYPIRTVNAFVQPGGAAATVTAATAPVANTPILPLTTYAAGRAPCPQMVSGVSVSAMGIDMGIETVTYATAGTITMAAPSIAGNVWRYNKPGLWLALLNGGAAGACMFTQVTSVNPSTGVINVSPAPAVSGSGQIALTNRYNPNLYAAGPPTGLSSEAPAGSARISIPEVANTRGLGIVAVGAGTATSYLLRGIDGYGSPQSEIVAVGSAAGTYWGKKTYDIFISCTPLSADAGRTTVQVVVSDFIGLPLSVMSNNSIQSVLYGAPGAQTAQIPTPYATSNYTVIPADTTSPATQSTGDPRGGIQVSANGPAVALGLTAPATGMVLVGTSLLTIQQILDPLAVALSSAVNPGPLLGVPPA